MENECHGDWFQNAIQTDRTSGDQLVENFSNPPSSDPKKSQLVEVNSSNCYGPTYDSDCDSISERDRLEREVLEELDKVIQAKKADDLQEHMDDERDSGQEGNTNESANSFLDLEETKSGSVRFKLGVPRSLWTVELRDLHQRKNFLVKILKGIRNQPIDKNTENDALEGTRAEVNDMEETIVSKLTALKMDLLQRYTEEELQNMYSKQLECCALVDKNAKQWKKRAKKARAKKARQEQRNQKKMNSVTPEPPFTTNLNLKNFAMPSLNLPNRVNCGKGLAGDFPGQYDGQSLPVVAGNVCTPLFFSLNGPRCNFPAGDVSSRLEQNLHDWSDNIRPLRFSGPNSLHFNIPDGDIPGQYKSQNRHDWADDMRPHRFSGPDGRHGNIPDGDSVVQYDSQYRYDWTDNIRPPRFCGPNGPNCGIPEKFPVRDDYQTRHFWRDSTRPPRVPGSNRPHCDVPDGEFPVRFDYQARHYRRPHRYPGQNGPPCDIPNRKFPDQYDNQTGQDWTNNIKCFSGSKGLRRNISTGKFNGRYDNRHDRADNWRPFRFPDSFRQERKGNFPGRPYNQNQQDWAGHMRRPRFPGLDGPLSKVFANDFPGHQNPKNRTGMAANTRPPQSPSSNDSQFNSPPVDFPSRHDNQTRHDWAENKRHSDFLSPKDPQCHVPSAPRTHYQIGSQDFRGCRDPSEQAMSSTLATRLRYSLCGDSLFAPNFICPPHANISNRGSPSTVLHHKKMYYDKAPPGEQQIF